jgi:hypothetical protein
MHGSAPRPGPLGLILCAGVLLSATLAGAQAGGGPEPDARALLLGMATHLGKTPELAVTVRAAWDTMQPSGEKIEWHEKRTLTLRRPDRLRVETEKSDGTRTLVVLDGTQINALDETRRVYAQAPQPGALDQAFVHLVRDLGVRVPLAALFASRAGEDMDRRVRSVDYVAKTAVLGAPAHHLAGRTDTVSFQMWIAAEGPPLPQRIVLTYLQAQGQPQFRAEFSAWSLAADPAATAFTFSPPAGAMRIPFAGIVAQAASAQGSASPKSAAPPKKGAKQ